MGEECNIFDSLAELIIDRNNCVIVSKCSIFSQFIVVKPWNGDGGGSGEGGGEGGVRMQTQ